MHPARALVILTPDIGTQYFRDVAEIANAAGGPSPVRMAEVMARYGLVKTDTLGAGSKRRD